jgi:hypothetical protein
MMASVSVSPKQQADLILRQAVYPTYITQQHRSAVQILCIARHYLTDIHRSVVQLRSLDGKTVKWSTDEYVVDAL